MKSTNVRRVTLSIAVATALSGVAACTSSGSGGSGKDHSASGKGATHISPVAALRTVEKSTDSADSARVESATTIGSQLSMKSDGALDWGDGIQGTVTITYTGGTSAELMRQTGTTSMEARYLPDAYYAKMGAKFAEQVGGKHWIRYAYADLANLAGGSGALLKDQMRKTTPNQSVKLLLASGDVKKVGSEQVRGVDTTHYSGTVDIADFARKNASLPASQLAALKKALTQAGVSTETVDIWVDGKDLLVKKVEKGTMSAGEYTQTAYYSDYGTKVSARTPPASDTADFTELVKQQKGTGVGS